MNLIPVVNKSIEIRSNENEIMFIDKITDKIFTFVADKSVIELFKLIDGKKTIENLYTELKQIYNNIELDDLLNVIRISHQKKIILDSNENKVNNSLEETTWSRQIPFWKKFSKSTKDGFDIQTKIHKSHICIVGLGGTGSWVAMYLAQLGIGELTLIDFDRISLSNLNRQLLYQIEDIGKSKIEAAECNLKKINPDILINKYDLKIVPNSNLDEILSTVDFVISCADEPNVASIARILSKECMKLNIPHSVGGGYNGHLGMLGPTIIPFETPCWECYEMSVKEEPEWRQMQLVRASELSEAPSLNLVSSFVANIQTFEIIKSITGVEKPILFGKKGEIDFNTLEITYTRFKREPTCEKCGKKKNFEMRPKNEEIRH